MQSSELIKSLIDITNASIKKAEILQLKPLPDLLWRENETSWNILECIAHLNLYGDYYLAAIKTAIEKSETLGEKNFKPGLLGDYFAKSMLPKEKLNKMKTFKRMNPLHSNPDKDVLHLFIQQQIEIVQLLKRSENISLNKVKIPISIAKFIKLKLGDTFRFVINHNIRHIKQIEKIENQYQHQVKL